MDNRLFKGLLEIYKKNIYHTNRQCFIFLTRYPDPSIPLDCDPGNKGILMTISSASKKEKSQDWDNECGVSFCTAATLNVSDANVSKSVEESLRTYKIFLSTPDGIKQISRSYLDVFVNYKRQIIEKYELSLRNNINPPDIINLWADFWSLFNQIFANDEDSYLELKNKNIQMDFNNYDIYKKCAVMTYYTMYYSIENNTKELIGYSVPSMTGSDKNKILTKLEQDKVEFDEKISYFPINTLARFNALTRLSASENAYACTELGDIYYIGAPLTYESSIYKTVEANYLIAHKYYSIAVKKYYPPACWALADMLLKHTEIEITSRDAYIEKLLDIAIEGNYIPGHNTKGIYYQMKADNCNDFLETKKYLGKAVEAFKDGGRHNYAFSYNRLYLLYTNESYSRYPEYHNKSIAISYLTKAVELNEPWSMNRYAKFLFDEKEETVKAMDLWETLSNMYDYPWANYNIALYKYKDNHPSEYIAYMTRAARLLPQACIELAEFYKTSIASDIEERNKYNLNILKYIYHAIDIYIHEPNKTRSSREKVYKKICDVYDQYISVLNIKKENPAMINVYNDINRVYLAMQNEHKLIIESEHPIDKNNALYIHP